MRIDELTLELNTADPIKPVAPSQSVAPWTSDTKVRWNNKVWVAILGMVIGTGGVANATAVNSVIRSGSTVGPHFKITVVDENTDKRADLSSILLPQEQLAGIQRYFSLNISDLAKVLRVARPTVYSWLRGVQPQGQHSARLNQLYRVARSWRSLSSSPVGEYLSAPLGDNSSLMSYLSTETLDEAAIQETLSNIRVARAKKARRESISEIASRHGLPVASAGSRKRWTDEDEFSL